MQCHAIRQTELAFHPGDEGPPRGEGRREADPTDRQIDRASDTFALPGRPTRAELNKGADRLQLGPA